MSTAETAWTDAQLTGYLDDALSQDERASLEAALAADPALRQQLDQLRLPDGLLQNAFDVQTIGAPSMSASVLAKMEAEAKATAPEVPKAANIDKRPGFFWPLALAASFALGMMVMPVLRPASTQNWVDTVASYQALYVTETLAGKLQSPEVTQTVLTRAENLLGVDLQGVLDIDGLTFKRAQMLSLDGAPLVQMAYLDAQGQPFAFCLTARNTDDQADQSRMSFDLATASWIENGVGFVLVGGQDGETTREIAAKFRRAI